nr:endoplasmin homolog [Tanacetum cinerariifolium]
MIEVCVGVTMDDLTKNLGTIAKSGTSAFVEKMYVCESKVDDAFAISEDTYNKHLAVELKLDCTLGRKLWNTYKSQN